MSYLTPLTTVLLCVILFIIGNASGTTETTDSEVIDQLSLGDLFDLKVTIASKV